MVASFGLASIRHNLPVAARKFCAVKSNLNSEVVNGNVAVWSFLVGHNLNGKDIRHFYLPCSVHYIQLNIMNKLCIDYVYVGQGRQTL